MKPITLLRVAAVTAALFAGAAQAAEMTIFGQPGFEGRSFTLKGNANLADIHFQNRVSSLIVRSGTWEVCTEPDLRGECVTLRPGEYPRLDPRLNDRIESMRVMDRYSGRDRRGSVAIYSQSNFTGKSVTLKDDAADLTPHGLQDQASSIVVHSGRWEFCTQPNYRGDCMTLARGEYADLDQRLKHRVESVREVDRVAGRGDRHDDRERYGWR